MELAGPPRAAVPAVAAPRERPRAATLGRSLVAAVGGIGLATGIAVVARPVTSPADVVMLYLLVVLVCAFTSGRAAAVLAAALSVAAFNFFFVPPFHTFAVADTRNLLTFAVLFAVGLAASALAERLRRQETDARDRERRTAALLALTRATAGADDEAAVAAAVVHAATGRIAAGAALWVERGGAPVCAAEAGSVGDGEAALVAASWTGTGAQEHAGATVFPVDAPSGRLGLLVLRGPLPDTADLADAWVRQTALALARVRHARAADEATLRARAEELRSALLSTVSHDLRTPLAAITGAATTLLDGAVVVPPEARRELLTSVRDEAARLERLVGNLLEMTRLSSGPLVLRRAWVPCDEIVGAAFARVDPGLAGHPVTVDLPATLPLVEIDPVVFEHVFVNLLENAARHSPPGTPIHLTARVVDDDVVFVIRDEGPGFPPGDLDALFEPFVRGDPPRAPGSGLGLAICRGIVRAHGGTIHAERPAGGGAAVRITLPRRRPPPSLPPEGEEIP